MTMHRLWTRPVRVRRGYLRVGRCFVMVIPRPRTAGRGFVFTNRIAGRRIGWTFGTRVGGLAIGRHL